MTRRPVVLPPLPFPHGRAVSAYVTRERSRVRRSLAARYAVLVLSGLLLGSGLGMASAELRADPGRLVAFAR